MIREQLSMERTARLKAAERLQGLEARYRQLEADNMQLRRSLEAHREGADYWSAGSTQLPGHGATAHGATAHGAAGHGAAGHGAAGHGAAGRGKKEARAAPLLRKGTEDSTDPRGFRPSDITQWAIDAALSAADWQLHSQQRRRASVAYESAVGKQSGMGARNLSTPHSAWLRDRLAGRRAKA